MKKKVIFLISLYTLVTLCTPATMFSMACAGCICLCITIGYLYIDGKYEIIGKRQGIILQYIIVIALLMNTLGSEFYERWIYSSKVKMIAESLSISNNIFLILIDAILIICACYSVVQIWNEIAILLKNTSDEIKVVLYASFYAAIVNSLPQMMLGIPIFSMGLIKYFIGTLLVLTCIMVCFALTGKVKLSIVLPSLFFVCLSTANAYVYSFRFTMLEVTDFMSIKTAWNVVGNYHLFPIPVRIFSAWCVFIGIGIFLFRKKMCLEAACWKKARKFSAIIGICLTVGLSGYILNINPQHWKTNGASINGYFLDFFSKIKELNVKEPDGYDPKDLENLSNNYKNKSEEVGKTPHIIVIMDESFADLNVIGNLETNMEVMPYISSLKENAITGYALSSVFGGNTANSEYEFLTGNSMAWVPTNSIPYQQYMKDNSYSIVSYLKQEYNYECIAMHPYESSGWNRTNVYSYFGFDDWMFLEDFPQQKLWRNLVSDEELFEQMIQFFEEKKESPLFLFGITMQNHGGYDYEGDNYEKTIYLKNNPGKYPKAEQYLSCIHESDRAVEQLIEYFKKVEDDVVICFFGDHMPGIETEFYEELNGGELDSLNEEQNKYKIPFFIWTNYGIENQVIECTSINYLSNYLYEAANISMPPYNQFLKELQVAVPALNANGYYSKSQGCFLDYDEMNSDDVGLLSLYEKWQYNNLFDIENRVQLMFPAN